MMSRWLALYIDTAGQPRAAMVSVSDENSMPIGVDEFELGLADYDGEPVTLVEMPNDPSFRPAVVDVSEDRELPMQFIDS